MSTKKEKQNIMKNLTIQQVKEATQEVSKEMGISEYTFNKRFKINERAFLIGQHLENK